jgi:adenine-specific DNA-methyltransferase
MPVKYVPYYPNTVEGQAILNNFTRSRRALRYRDDEKAQERIKRGMPRYELEKIESVGNKPENMIIRGECLSACAYLKDKGVEIDLVYIDPPFASGADYAKKVYLRRNPEIARKIAEGMEEYLANGNEDQNGGIDIEGLRSFEEKMYGDIWNKEDYLNWMFENLVAIKSVMSENASIYVHLDWHIGHYVKILMDEVFGEDNFRNEIIVRRVKKSIRENEKVKSLNVATDSIYLYVKSEDVLILPPSKPAAKEERWHAFDAPEIRTGMDYDLFGKKPPAGRHWMRSYEIAQQWIKDEKLRPNPSSGKPEYKIDASDEMICDSLWDDLQAYTFEHDYTTEKNPDLLERIIKASSDEGMIVADFFGGSGVTAKAANDLKRKFIHVDVGINSIQTVRDRLVSTGAEFDIHDVKDGVSLFRNPVQTMDKLKTLIVGLKNEDSLDSFWEGAINDSKLGLVPVYIPNLLDHSTKILDVPLMNRILNIAMPELPDSVKKVVVFYVDIEDEKELKDFIKDNNPTEFEVELRDLKEILDDVIVEDIAEYEMKKSGKEHVIEFKSFTSDRLIQKIGEYNQKHELQKVGENLLEKVGDEQDEENDDADAEAENGSNRNGNGKKINSKFTPIKISETGLELIELVSLNCSNNEGAWKSDSEIKIDKKGYVIRNGKKTKDFWDGRISSPKKPIRIKIRNICGDESVQQIKVISKFAK